MASGYVRALAAGCNSEEAAYLFMQWVNGAAALSRAHDATVYIARSLSALHLQVRRVSGAVASGQGVSRQPVRMRQLGGRRHDHARLAGLCAIHRPECSAVWGGRIQRRLCRRRQLSGTRPPRGWACRRKKRPIRNFSTRPAADHTVEKLGQAVHVTLEGSEGYRPRGAQTSSSKSSRRSSALRLLSASSSRRQWVDCGMRLPSLANPARTRFLHLIVISNG